MDKNHIQELFLPKFFLCEDPIKKGNSLDSRKWIYSPNYLSLIEVVSRDSLMVFDRSLFTMNFDFDPLSGFEPQRFSLIIVQNNCGFIGENETEFLEKAWIWFRSHLEEQLRNILNANN
jgi:hypothetical protein